ncbi:unnamed protein product [Acanthoscelides obtectus]|uniref:Peptidase S1 domain-containing protein n=1 Tax=Acanthoscelides obtectus TaxID=200917 RepID=A0A9P0P5S8_ACAOB|nr:unnamed protein product [Acanthoscelides obtectus]CAK1628168.1 Serine protease snake [Acanthoscelides obtectus]
MFFKILEFSVLLCIGHLVYAQVGDRCFFQGRNKEGICKLFHDCRSAEEGARRDIEPTVCGYQRNTIIVCCEDSNRNENYNNYQSHNYSPQTNEDPYRPETSDFIFPDQELPIRDRDPIKENTGSSRISEQKCKEYNKAIVGEVQVLPLVANPQPISIKINKCDHNSVPLIVGGKPAQSGKYPFMAALGFNTDEKWLCGGTLISHRFILTAAHCTSSRSGSPVVVRLGALYLSQETSTSEDYRVADIIVHPNYRYPEKYNDIALIRVERDIKFTKYVRPACLYTKDHISQKAAIATGWGRIDYAGETSDRLLEVNLNIYDNSLCQKAYRNNNGLANGITSTMICAGELKGGKDTCQVCYHSLADQGRTQKGARGDSCAPPFP